MYSRNLCSRKNGRLWRLGLPRRQCRGDSGPRLVPRSGIGCPCQELYALISSPRDLPTGTGAGAAACVACLGAELGAAGAAGATVTSRHSSTYSSSVIPFGCKTALLARHSAWHAFTVFPWARARDAAIQNPAEHTTATIPIFMFWLLNSATVCSGIASIPRFGCEGRRVICAPDEESTMGYQGESRQAQGTALL